MLSAGHVNITDDVLYIKRYIQSQRRGLKSAASQNAVWLLQREPFPANATKG